MTREEYIDRLIESIAKSLVEIETLTGWQKNLARKQLEMSEAELAKLRCQS